MLGNLAHEMRTPLAILDGYLQAIDDGVQAADEENVALLRDQVARLTRLEEDIAVVTTAEEGRLSMHWKAVSVTDLLGAARAQALSIPSASGFSSSPAVGVQADVEGMRIAVGGPYLLQEHRLAELSVAEAWREEGAIILHVLADGAVIGALRLADEIRAESRATVDALHEAGIQVAMITGDARQVAQARALGVGHAQGWYFRAALTPEALREMLRATAGLVLSSVTDREDSPQ